MPGGLGSRAANDSGMYNSHNLGAPKFTRPYDDDDEKKSKKKKKIKK